MKLNKRNSIGHSARAFTLVELMVALAIFAILIGIGFPSLNQTVRQNRVSAQTNELVALISFARNEAIRRNTSVAMLLAPNSNGWDVIIEDPSAAADITGCVPGQLRCASNTGVNLVLDSSGLIFNERGYIRGASDEWTSETMYLQHESCNGDRERQRINIRPTGQIQSCSLPCNSTSACS